MLRITNNPKRAHLFEIFSRAFQLVEIGLNPRKTFFVSDSHGLMLDDPLSEVEYKALLRSIIIDSLISEGYDTWWDRGDSYWEGHRLILTTEEINRRMAVLQQLFVEFSL